MHVSMYLHGTLYFVWTVTSFHHMQPDYTSAIQRALIFSAIDGDELRNMTFGCPVTVKIVKIAEKVSGGVNLRGRETIKHMRLPEYFCRMFPVDNHSIRRVRCIFYAGYMRVKDHLLGLPLRTKEKRISIFLITNKIIEII